MVIMDSYRDYSLNNNSNVSYYSLIGCLESDLLDNIQNRINSLEFLCAIPNNSANSKSCMQWTDLQQIAATFSNRIERRKYDSVHYLAEYIPSNDYKVKYMLLIDIQIINFIHLSRNIGFSHNQ